MTDSAKALIAEARRRAKLHASHVPTRDVAHSLTALANLAEQALEVVAILTEHMDCDEDSDDCTEPMIRDICQKEPLRAALKKGGF